LSEKNCPGAFLAKLLILENKPLLTSACMTCGVT
jgi:predicted nucleic-acid-binding Zn-ribbon protein